MKRSLRLFPLLLACASLEVQSWLTCPVPKSRSSRLPSLQFQHESPPVSISLTDKNVVSVSPSDIREELNEDHVVDDELDVIHKFRALCNTEGPEAATAFWTENDVPSSRVMFHILLNAYIKNGNLDQARSIIKQMEESDLESQPLTCDYNVMLKAYAKMGNVPAIEKLLKRMLDRCNHSTEPSIGIVAPCKPDIYSYNILLDGLGHSNQVTAGERAEEILDTMIDQFGGVNAVVYNKVLKVWKNTNAPQTALRAEKILKRMVDQNIADRISYTSYITILANIGTEEAAQRASEIVENMLQACKKGSALIKPNSQTWDNVVLAWVRCGNMDRAAEIIQRMENLQADGETEMSPNVVTFSIIMDGLAKSNEKGALTKMEAIFDRMWQLYDDGNLDARPNAFTYVTMIHAYAKARSPSAAQKAEDLLFKMYDEYQNGNVDLKPNTQLVSAVMDAWVKSGASNAAEKAEQALDWMLSVYEKDHQLDLAPNEYSFSTAISAWAKSRKLRKCAHARRILNKMIELHDRGELRAKPNTICFTAVINSCAYCENDDVGKREALRIAIATYKDLEKSGNKANNVTYLSLLTAIRNLLPGSPKRDLAVKDVFISAANNGYVDDLVLQRAKSALPPDAFQSLLPDVLKAGDVIDWRDIPHEWRRNVDCCAA